MKLRWMPRALQDLRTIGQYIGNDRPRAAREWIERLRKRARQAVAMPTSGRVVPEYAREDIRELVEGGYRLVYRVRPNSVDILTVFEGHRLLKSDPPDLDLGPRE